MVIARSWQLPETLESTNMLIGEVVGDEEHVEGLLEVADHRSIFRKEMASNIGIIGISKPLRGCPCTERHCRSRSEMCRDTELSEATNQATN